MVHQQEPGMSTGENADVLEPSSYVSPSFVHVTTYKTTRMIIGLDSFHRIAGSSKYKRSYLSKFSSPEIIRCAMARNAIIAIGPLNMRNILPAIASIIYQT